MLGWTMFSTLCRSELEILAAELDDDGHRRTPAPVARRRWTDAVKQACARMIELHEQRCAVRATPWSFPAGRR